MPTFYSDADVDVEVQEFVDSCSKSEIKELIEYLVEEGHINQSAVPSSKSAPSATDDVFEEHLNCLHGRRHMLTNEEEETIIKIASKFRYL